MKIYTITLSPAYDIHAYTAHFEPFHENLAETLSRDAGGKGVNISRALTVWGTPNTALVVVGRDNASDFISQLDKAKMSYEILERQGRIRENLTLHTSDSDETRISFSGFSADEGLLDEIEAKIEPEESIVTFTGRVPKGISMRAVKSFLLRLADKGAKIVIDSRSFTLDDIFEVKPWLIKPNQEEISEFFGQSITTVEEAAEKAREIGSRGVENVMISLGSLGALLFDGEATHTATPPKINALSTIGAGDSSIAGFVSAFAEGQSASACLRLAVAFGSAACLTEGSLPPEKQDIEQIYQKIEIK